MDFEKLKIDIESIKETLGSLRFALLKIIMTRAMLLAGRRAGTLPLKK